MPRESEVSKDIVKFLKSSSDVLWYSRLNSGREKNAYSGAWVQMSKKGTPDFIAIVTEGINIHVLFIEVKRPGGKRTIEQEAFADKITYPGFINLSYLVAESAEDVIAEVNNLC